LNIILANPRLIYPAYNSSPFGSAFGKRFRKNLYFFLFWINMFLCFQIILMCWFQKWFLKNKKILLAYFSKWKAFWKATTTTLPNTLLNQVMNQVKSYNRGVFLRRLEDYLSIIIATWMPILTWKKSWHKHGIN